MVEGKNQWKAWLYLAPALILLLIFTVWPIFNTLRIAFLEDYGQLSELGGETFKFGFGNFKQVVEYQKLFKNNLDPMRDYGSYFNLFSIDNSCLS